MPRLLSFFKKFKLKEIKNPHFNKPINFTWITDTHLSSDMSSIKELISKLNSNKGDFILHTGDITNCYRDTKEILLQINNFLKKPFYFVLGNHDYEGPYEDIDFYKGDSVNKVQKSLNNRSGSKVVWLGADVYIPLNNETALVGIDGFPNMKPYQSNMDAENLENKLIETHKLGFKNIIIATHIPPFPNTCRDPHSNKNNDGILAPALAEYLQEYCAESTGKVIEKFSKKFTNININTYCGHTHAPHYFKHNELNITVTVGNAYKRDKRICGIKLTPLAQPVCCNMYI